MWKSTSSNGWECLIIWEDLGSSSLYAICVLFNLLLFLISEKEGFWFLAIVEHCEEWISKEELWCVHEKKSKIVVELGRPLLIKKEH